METEEKQIVVYIDTNVWFGYLNSTRSRALFKKTKDAKSFFELLSGRDDVRVVFSYFNFIELSSVVKDAHICNRLLGEGYSVFQLSGKIKGKKLTDEEKKLVDKDLIAVTSLKFVYPEIDKPMAISEERMGDLSKLTGNGVEMPDSLHVIHALMHECSVFITSDAPFYTALKEIQSEFKDFQTLKVLNCKEIIENPSVLKS